MKTQVLACERAQLLTVIYSRNMKGRTRFRFASISLNRSIAFGLFATSFMCSVSVFVCPSNTPA